jgi:CheY-like chemotaxis protein
VELPSHLINNLNNNNNNNNDDDDDINNHRILLVDDENDILNLFCDCLQKFGYETMPFNNPIDALNYINTSNISNCSLIITDYKMPQMSGIDLIKKIREKDNDYKIKTIIISAYIKDNLPYDKSYIKLVDRILEKPVIIDFVR